MVQSARKNVTGAGICTFFLSSAALPPRLAVVFDGRRATLLSGRENPDPSVDVTVHLTAARGRRSVPRRERVPCACGRRHGRLRISCLVPEGRVGAAGETSGGQPQGGGEEGGRDPHERPRRGLRDACSRSRGTGALTCSSGTTPSQRPTPPAARPTRCALFRTKSQETEAGVSPATGQRDPEQTGGPQVCCSLLMEPEVRLSGTHDRLLGLRLATHRHIMVPPAWIMTATEFWDTWGHTFSTPTLLAATSTSLQGAECDRALGQGVRRQRLREDWGASVPRRRGAKNLS